MGGEHHSHRTGAGEEDRSNQDASHHAGHAEPAPGRDAVPAGLSIAVDGARLVPSDTRFAPVDSHQFAFEIRDDDGDPITEFEPTHGELCHLIVVRRDLTRFQHLHPEIDPDGTWSQQLRFPAAGVYRAFVEVRTAGRPVTLGTDLFAPGTFEPDPRPTSSREATADGYVVTLQADEVRAREELTLEFEVGYPDGRDARLEEYLEALGHLVVLREGDLGYVHVHPEATGPASGRVRFGTRFPSPGRYRLFLQVKPEGELITTAFDVRIAEPRS